MLWTIQNFRVGNCCAHRQFRIVWFLVVSVTKWCTNHEFISAKRRMQREMKNRIYGSVRYSFRYHQFASMIRCVRVWWRRLCQRSTYSPLKSCSNSTLRCHTVGAKSSKHLWLQDGNWIVDGSRIIIIMVEQRVSVMRNCHYFIQIYWNECAAKTYKAITASKSESKMSKVFWWRLVSVPLWTTT